MAGKSLLTVLATVALILHSATAATYTVRDNLGWRVPSGGAAEYVNWASGITFLVDDILVFNFSTGAHDVARVTKENFDSCNTNVPINLYTVGPATVTINTTGQYNFICTFGNHCNNGQKLSINVTTLPPTSPPPAPATPSPPPAPATPSPPPAPSTPSPPPAPSTPSPPPAPSTPSPPPAPSTPSPPPAPSTPSPPPAPSTPSPPPAPSTPSPPPAPSTPSSPPPAPGSPEIPTSPPPPTTLSPPQAPGSPEIPTSPPPPITSSPPPSSTPTPPSNVIPPPPPNSGPRSLTVLGIVFTLLAIAMGLTL